MQEGMNRRSFLQLGVVAGATAMAPRWIRAQAAPAAQPHPSTGDAPIKATKLYDNLYLLQGTGGNMALQTGPEGNILIDSSYAPAVPRIREAIAAVSKDAPFVLINTHWHGDHTGGNEGMHAAGFTICAHQKTRERLSTTQTLKVFQRTFPPSPAGALPTVTFERELRMWHNGDSLDLVHIDPSHTDTDIYINFHKAGVLHLGDTFFNGMYPVIDESTGGSIGGMIRASEMSLAMVSDSTKIIPGHGPLGSKSDLQKFHDMLSAIRDKMAALKAAGASEQEALAKNPTAEFDAAWGKGVLSKDVFAGTVYRTL